MIVTLNLLGLTYVFGKKWLILNVFDSTIVAITSFKNVLRHKSCNTVQF